MILGGDNSIVTVFRLYSTSFQHSTYKGPFLRRKSVSLHPLTPTIVAVLLELTEWEKHVTHLDICRLHASSTLFLKGPWSQDEGLLQILVFCRVKNTLLQLKIPGNYTATQLSTHKDIPQRMVENMIPLIKYQQKEISHSDKI